MSNLMHWWVTAAFQWLTLTKLLPSNAQRTNDCELCSQKCCSFQTYFLDHLMRTDVLKWVNSFEVTGLSFLARAGLIKKCDPCSGKKSSILTHGTDTLSFLLKRSAPVNISSPLSRQKKKDSFLHILSHYEVTAAVSVMWCIGQIKVKSVQSVACIPCGVLTGEEEEVEEKQRWMEGRLQTADYF